VLAEKPTDIWKVRFYALKKGTGFRLEDMASEWGTSTDTVRCKAKANGALRYVEDPKHPGMYVACVAHPSTPKGK